MLPLAHYLPEFDDDDGTPFERSAAARGERRPTFETPILVSSRELVAERVPEIVTSPIREIDEVGVDAEAPAFDAGEFTDAMDGADWPMPELADVADDEGECESSPNLETAVDEAMEEQRAARQAEILEAVNAARAEEREAAEAEKLAAVDAARAEWAAAEGERIATLLSDRIDRVETVLRTTLSAVLRPIAVNARRRQSVLELADAARMLIGDGKALAIRAVGPSDLLTAFAAALGTRSEFVTCRSDETLVDVRIECDQTVIETRLEGWRKALEEALG